MLRRGFTLIELVVALGLLGVVLLFVFDTFSYQHATYTVTDQLSEAHQNSGAAARLIERDVRAGGYLVYPQAAACGADSTSAPDTLFVSDTDAILTPDALPLEVAGKSLGVSVTTADDPTAVGLKLLNVDGVVLDDNPATPSTIENASYDTDSDGYNDSDFRQNAGAILVDVNNPTRGVACGIVSAVDMSPPDSVTVTFQTILGTTAAQPKKLVLVPAHVYDIAVVSGTPRLRRDGVLLAQDVEDLQLAWFYDDDTDGVVDTNEVRGVSGNNYATNAVDGTELREIRVNLVMRTRTNDPRNPDNTSIGQQRENRSTSVAAADGKHRRVHTATVRIRNMSL